MIITRALLVLILAVLTITVLSNVAGAVTVNGVLSVNGGTATSGWWVFSPDDPTSGGYTDDMGFFSFDVNVPDYTDFALRASHNNMMTHVGAPSPFNSGDGSPIMGINVDYWSIRIQGTIYSDGTPVGSGWFVDVAGAAATTDSSGSYTIIDTTESMSDFTQYELQAFNPDASKETDVNIWTAEYATQPVQQDVYFTSATPTPTSSPTGPVHISGTVYVNGDPYTGGLGLHRVAIQVWVDGESAFQLFPDSTGAYSADLDESNNNWNFLAFAMDANNDAKYGTEGTIRLTDGTFTQDFHIEDVAFPTATPNPLGYTPWWENHTEDNATDAGLSTTDYNMMMEGTFGNGTWDSFNGSEIIMAATDVFINPLSDIFYAALVGLFAAMLYLKYNNTFIPSILFMLGGFIIIPLTPPDWVFMPYAMIALGIGGLIYSLVRGTR